MLKDKLVLGILKSKYPDLYHQLDSESTKLLSNFTDEEIKALSWYSNFIDSLELYEIVRIPSKVREVSRKYVRYYLLTSVVVVVILILLVDLLTHYLSHTA